MTRPASLEYTNSPEANAFIAANSIAFIIGFILDQQIKVQQAFLGPATLRERWGHLDPEQIVEMGEEAVIEAASSPSPIHRYPRSMGKRIFQCMKYIVDQYEGDADRIWLEAADHDDLRRRLQNLPGFGASKAWVVSAIIDRKFGTNLPGWELDLPPYGSLALVDSLDDLAEYQRRKGEYKKAMRAAKKASGSVRTDSPATTNDPTTTVR